MGRIILAFVGALTFSIGTANAYTYEWVQTSFPEVAFSITISLAGTGTLGDLPTLDSGTVTTPINFGKLIGFSFEGSTLSYTLNDFIPTCTTGPSTTGPSCGYGYPDWDIEPGPVISFLDAGDAQNFYISPDFISADTDNGFSPCNQGGFCIASGYFVLESIPEPQDIPTFALAVLLTISLAGVSRSRLKLPLRIIRQRHTSV